MDESAEIADTVENGDKSERVDGINCWFKMAGTGAAFVYKNETETTMLCETLKLTLEGFEVVGHSDPSDVKVDVGPGAVKMIKLVPCEGATALSM